MREGLERALGVRAEIGGQEAEKASGEGGWGSPHHDVNCRGIFKRPKGPRMPGVKGIHERVKGLLLLVFLG